MKPLNLEHCLRTVEADKAVLCSAARVPYYPLVVKKARGSWVEDADGNRYIDFLASAAAVNVGHCHPKVVEAVREQAEAFMSYTAVYMYHEPLVCLSETLCRITPGDFPKRVIYGLSGSDANDGAIKLARWTTGRSKIVAFQRSYHGSTYGALSLSSLSLPMRRRMGPFLPEVYHFPYPDTFRPPFSGTDEEIAGYHLDLIRRAFADYIPGEEVAAVIIEPIQGDAGILVPPVSFMKGLRSLCDAHGILLIAEEVQQGFGRTGKWFGIEHFGIVPDAVILGKALGSGLPLSAIVAREDLMADWDAPAHCFTHAGNAVCCAAAYASVQVIEEEGLVARSEEMGNYLMERFRALQDSYPLIGDVRGKGLSIGVDLVKDGKTRERHGEAAAKICYQAWQKGLLLSFFSGSVLRIQPPLVITREEADRALEIIEEAMRDFLAGRISDEVLKTVKGW